MTKIEKSVPQFIPQQQTEASPKEKGKGKTVGSGKEAASTAKAFAKAQKGEVEELPNVGLKPAEKKAAKEVEEATAKTQSSRYADEVDNRQQKLKDKDKKGEIAIPKRGETANSQLQGKQLLRQLRENSPKKQVMVDPELADGTAGVDSSGSKAVKKGEEDLPQVGIGAMKSTSEIASTSPRSVERPGLLSSLPLPEKRTTATEQSAAVSLHPKQNTLDDDLPRVGLIDEKN
ncbi:MAG: hypothetical protein L7F78_13340 [Syntrophales bacterium LBB04]|nr:hypothetical protein [Syntrophales bacterium LBB04]